eukprot:2505411-Alexandrium_andersonii.AAC.1
MCQRTVRFSSLSALSVAGPLRLQPPVVAKLPEAPRHRPQDAVIHAQELTRQRKARLAKEAL